MAFVVIEHKALGPVDVGLLGAVGIVLEPNCIAHLVEQLLGLLCHANLPKSALAQGTQLWYSVDEFCKEPQQGVL